MKSVFFLFVLLLVFSTTAQENINYRVPSQEILALADFERAPSVSMDTKKRVHAVELQKSNSLN